MTDNHPDFLVLSEFSVPKMDCPSEERMIRLVFESVTPSPEFIFDLPNRQLKIYHHDNFEEVKRKLESLNFGATLINSRSVNTEDQISSLQNKDDSSEAKTLRLLLLINATMFIIELIVGWYAQSTGLISDSLDMLADACVYGLALYAVGKASHMKLRLAHLSGWFQLILALGVLFEVFRRFIVGSEPESTLMMSFGLLALIANVACVMLLFKNKDGGAHMKATWIFSTNDVIANIGVIIAGFLVYLSQSPYPDLLIGLIIALIVINGAKTILQLKAN